MPSKFRIIEFQGGGDVLQISFIQDSLLLRLAAAVQRCRTCRNLWESRSFRRWGNVEFIDCPCADCGRQGWGSGYCSKVRAWCIGRERLEHANHVIFLQAY